MPEAPPRETQVIAAGDVDLRLVAVAPDPEVDRAR